MVAGVDKSDDSRPRGEIMIRDDKQRHTAAVLDSVSSVCVCVCDDAGIPPELSPLSSLRTTWGSPSLPSCCDISSPGPTASPSPGRLARVLFLWGGNDEHQAKQIIRLLESAAITDFHFVHPVISFSFHFIYSIDLKRVREKHEMC